ncbi:MAG TPA: flagellar biosynthetic protein FliO [Acidimicrobiales bacterium]|nr:flagellar biosynthetic protein FliO [Acidimicrobiales bacterium]
MRYSAEVWAATHHASVTTGHGTTTAQSVSASSLLVQMVIGLVVIIALIKVASRLVQGKGGRALGAGRRHGAVAVVGRQSLGKGVQVALVTAEKRTFLLGVTQRQVTLLGQLDAGGTATTGSQDLAVGDLQLLPGGEGSASPDDSQGPVWKSAIEQMRAKTVRRA